MKRLITKKIIRTACLTAAISLLICGLSFAEETTVPRAYVPDISKDVLPIRSQGDWGTCWAFATIGAVEADIYTNIYKKNPAYRDLDLSEVHLAWYGSDGEGQKYDPLGNITFDRKIYNRNRYEFGNPNVNTKNFLNYGDNTENAMWTLASWIGPVYESQMSHEAANDAYTKYLQIEDKYENEQLDIYVTEDVKPMADGNWYECNKEAREEFYNYLMENGVIPGPEDTDMAFNNDAFHVQGVDMIPFSDRDSVKRAILEHGAVTVDMWENTAAGNRDESYEYFNAENNCLYDPDDIRSNHALLIVGWDDGFKKEKFNEGYRPRNDGAWLVRNSHYGFKSEADDQPSDSFSHSRYFWISYENASENDYVLAFHAEPADNYSNNYQYDGTGNSYGEYSMSSYATAGAGPDPDGGYGYANLYQAKGNPGGYETIDAVSFGSRMRPGVTYPEEGAHFRIDVYTQTDPSEDLVEAVKAGKKPAATVEKFCTKFSGYHTARLNESVVIPEGSWFLVSIMPYEDVSMFYELTGEAGGFNYEANLCRGQSFGTQNNGILSYESGTDNFEISRMWDLSVNEGRCMRIKGFTTNLNVSISQRTGEGGETVPSVKVTRGKETLTEGTDYTVSLGDGETPVTKEVIIQLTGKYKGEIRKEYTIEDPVKYTEGLISSIGTVEFKETVRKRIETARGAYDALTDDQKAQISAEALKKLTDAEDAYAQLREVSSPRTLEASGRIAAIGTVEYTDQCTARVSAARASYDRLTSSERKAITKSEYEKLAGAELELRNLKIAYDRAEADATMEKFLAIGNFDGSEGCMDRALDAFMAYAALSEAQKEQLDVSYRALGEEQQARLLNTYSTAVGGSREGADYTDVMTAVFPRLFNYKTGLLQDYMDAHGTELYTQEFHEMISEARYMYNHMSLKTRSLLGDGRYDILNWAAEPGYAGGVAELIEDISLRTYSEETAERIAAARSAYNALSKEEKGYVPRQYNEVLTFAENAYKELKPENGLESLGTMALSFAKIPQLTVQQEVMTQYVAEEHEDSGRKDTPSNDEGVPAAATSENVITPSNVEEIPVASPSDAEKTTLLNDEGMLPGIPSGDVTVPSDDGDVQEAIQTEEVTETPSNEEGMPEASSSDAEKTTLLNDEGILEISVDEDIMLSEFELFSAMLTMPPEVTDNPAKSINDALEAYDNDHPANPVKDFPEEMYTLINTFLAEQGLSSVEIGSIDNIIGKIRKCWEYDYYQNEINCDRDENNEFRVNNSKKWSFSIRVEEVISLYDALSEKGKECLSQLDYCFNHLVDVTDRIAAEIVIEKIKFIREVTYEELIKARIEAARSAYESLTDKQKGYVSADDLNILTAAESKYAGYDSQAAVYKNSANEVMDLIRYIFDVPTGSGTEYRERIDAARSAYEELDIDEKYWFKYVKDSDGYEEYRIYATQYYILLFTEEVYNERVTQDPDIENVVSLMKNISGNERLLTLRAKAEAAREAYDGLTEAQKDCVLNVYMKNLTDAEERIAEADASEAVTRIYEIGEADTVELSSVCLGRIEVARQSYDALSEQGKAAVKGEDLILLTAAEERYGELRQQADDETMAAMASEIIGAIGNVEYTDDCRDRILAARGAYDSLTESQKACITPEDLKVLTDAESAYAALLRQAREKAESEEDRKTSGEEMTAGETGTKESESRKARYTYTASDDSGDEDYIHIPPTVRPDKAVTPVTHEADGTQHIGGAVISLPVSGLTETEKALYHAGGRWINDSYGYWYFADARGTLLRNRWALISDALGSKPVGNASWYYFGEDGRMLTGWQLIGGHWYCLNKEEGSMYGACLLNGKTPDGYTVDTDGRWVR